MAVPIGQALAKFLALRANGSGTNIAAAVGVALALGLPALGVIDPMLIGAATTLGVSLTNYVVTHYLLKLHFFQSLEAAGQEIAKVIPQTYAAGSPEISPENQTMRGNVQTPTNPIAGGASTTSGGPP